MMCVTAMNYVYNTGRLRHSVSCRAVHNALYLLQNRTTVGTHVNGDM